ncbi:unnamed protein product [Amoebophrya sp. A120]|nr:unnamed protein product [Amoebophrya sp. A120]|eukprot:GSA120T00026353001.1
MTNSCILPDPDIFAVDKDILLRFRSVRHLYQLATNNEHDFLYPELTEKMQKYQAKIMKTALTWWRIALEL